MSQTVPETRVYRHLQCGTETVIGGQSFEVASNPLSDMTRTWCMHCNAHFPIAEYQWSDTGEKISDYYARHSTKATSLDRFLCSRKFMILCAATGFILGTAGGFFLLRDVGRWLQIPMTIFVGGVGAFIGCAIYLNIGKPITRRVCGVSDTRALT